MSNWNAQTDLNAVKDTVVQGTKKVRVPFSALCHFSPPTDSLALLSAGEHGDGFLQLDGELVVERFTSPMILPLSLSNTLPCGYDQKANNTTPTPLHHPTSKQAPKIILSLLSHFLVLLLDLFVRCTLDLLPPSISAKH
jgi:hypothetical protein